MSNQNNTPAWWREEFRLLDGLPLLPCGAGADSKAPLVSGWPEKRFSIDEVLEFDGLR